MKYFRVEDFQWQEPHVGPTDVPFENFTALTDKTQTIAAIQRAAAAESIRLEAVTVEGSAAESLAAAAEYVAPGVSEGLNNGQPLVGHLGNAALGIAGELPLTPAQKLRHRITFAPKVDPEQVGRDLLLRSFAEHVQVEKTGRALSVIEQAIQAEAESSLGGLRSLSADDTDLQVHTATRLGEGIVKTHRSHSGSLRRLVANTHRSHFGFVKQVLSKAVRFFKPKFS